MPTQLFGTAKLLQERHHPHVLLTRSVAAFFFLLFRAVQACYARITPGQTAPVRHEARPFEARRGEAHGAGETGLSPVRADGHASGHERPLWLAGAAACVVLSMAVAAALLVGARLRGAGETRSSASRPCLPPHVKNGFALIC